MKFTIKTINLNGTPQLLHNQRCVRAVAVIGRSKKKGIPRRFQKTWALPTVAPIFTRDQMQTSLYSEAQRWEKKIMKQIKKEAELLAALEAQKEKLD